LPLSTPFTLSCYLYTLSSPSFSHLTSSTTLTPTPSSFPRRTSDFSTSFFLLPSASHATSQPYPRFRSIIQMKKTCAEVFEQHWQCLERQNHVSLTILPSPPSFAIPPSLLPSHTCSDLTHGLIPSSAFISIFTGADRSRLV
jgi:hypothetical protein